MSRYATWKRGTNDPTSAWRWIFGGAGTPVYGPLTLPASPRKRKLVASLLLGTLAAAGVSLVLAPKLPFALVLIGFAALVPRLLADARGKPKSIAGEGPGESLWVRMTVQNKEGFSTGHDVGWLVSSEGWLLFEGERTSFALTRREAARAWYANDGSLRLPDRRTVVFAPLGEKTDPKPLERIVEGWQSAPIPEGEAILPPIGVHPEVWAARLAWFGLGTVLSLGVAAAGALYEAWSFGLVAVATLPFASAAERCARGLRRALETKIPG